MNRKKQQSTDQRKTIWWELKQKRMFFMLVTGEYSPCSIAEQKIENWNAWNISEALVLKIVRSEWQRHKTRTAKNKTAFCNNWLRQPQCFLKFSWCFCHLFDQNCFPICTPATTVAVFRRTEDFKRLCQEPRYWCHWRIFSCWLRSYLLCPSQFSRWSWMLVANQR